MVSSRLDRKWFRHGFIVNVFVKHERQWFRYGFIVNEFVKHEHQWFRYGFIVHVLSNMNVNAFVMTSSS